MKLLIHYPSNLLLVKDQRLYFIRGLNPISMPHQVFCRLCSQFIDAEKVLKRRIRSNNLSKESILKIYVDPFRGKESKNQKD